MAVTEQFSCDVCKKPKQGTNHWFAAYRENHMINVFFWTAVKAEKLRDYKHLCGQECVLKAVNEWMHDHR